MRRSDVSSHAEPNAARTDSVRHDFAPTSLGVTLGGGLAASIVTISYSVSLAALIFRGDLASSVGDGVGVALISTVIVGLATALSSSIPGVVPSVGGKSAAILAVAATSVAGTVDADALVPTVLAMSAVATLATGILCLLLGRYRLGTLVRYIPYPVVGGFMASAGLLTAVGGWELLAAGRPLDGLTSGDALGLWLPGLAIAAALLVSLHQRVNRLVLPALLVAGGIAIHVAFAIGGTGTAAAFARGWLLVDGSTGSSWRPDRIATVVDADWRAVFDHTGAIATVVVLVVVSLLLYAHGLELATDRDVDLERELRSTGWGSVVAAVGGGLPAYTNIEGSMLSVRIGGPRRGSSLVAAALAALVLAFSGTVLPLVPTALVGGLLIAIGIASVAQWTWGARHRLASFEVAIVVAIVAAVAVLGFVPGTVFGIAVTVVLFVVRYSRVSVVDRELSGATVTSNVDRTPAERAILDEHGDLTVLLHLRGYLFFGSANEIVDVVERRCAAGTRAIVFDFTGVTGVDSSTAVAFERIGRIAAHHRATLLVASATPSIRSVIGVLERRSDLDVRVVEDADRALQLAEESTLVRAGAGTGDVASTVTVRHMLSSVLHEGAAVDALVPHLRRIEAAAGDTLIREGDPPPGLFLLESGRLTATLDRDGAPVRLRSMLPGTMVGEISLYLDSAPTASVVADVPSVVWCLGAAEFERIGRDDPLAAAAIHRFAAQVLADRVRHAEKELRTYRA